MLSHLGIKARLCCSASCGHTAFLVDLWQVTHPPLSWCTLVPCGHQQTILGFLFLTLVWFPFWIFPVVSKSGISQDSRGFLTLQQTIFTLKHGGRHPWLDWDAHGQKPQLGRRLFSCSSLCRLVLLQLHLTLPHVLPLSCRLIQGPVRSGFSGISHASGKPPWARLVLFWASLSWQCVIHKCH